MISPAALATKSAGGLIIPDVDKTSPKQATVLAVGPGVTDKKGNLIPVPCKVGDTIVYAPGTMKEMKIDGNTYYVIDSSEVLAVLS